LPNKTTYYSDKVYGLLLQVSEAEHPNDKDGVNKVIQDAVNEKTQALAQKHQAKLSKKKSK